MFADEEGTENKVPNTAPTGNAPATAPTTSNLMAFAGARIDDEFEMKKLQVFVRVRPTVVTATTTTITTQQEEECIHASARHTLAIAPPPGSQAYKSGDRGQTFTFSQVFDAATTQEEYYRATAGPLVDDILRNPQHNSVMMAYGITAAGKTYTIEGCKTNPGVLPRTLHALLEGIATHVDAPVLAVRVSYCEIYNESVYDLLQPPNTTKTALRLMEDCKSGRVAVVGLQETQVTSAEEALLVLKRGSKQRQRAETGLNHGSSRSHSIFTLTLVRSTVYSHGDDGDTCHDTCQVERLGRMAFVDLAGSERAQRTGNVGIRLKESVAINSSLMTLGRCLEALRHNQQQQAIALRGGGPAPLKVVPFRESKVTHLFRDALHGYGRVILSVNVSPCAKDYDETAHVLRYASLATGIGTLQHGEAHRRTIKAVTPSALRRAAKRKAEKKGKEEVKSSKKNKMDVLVGGVGMEVEAEGEVEGAAVDAAAGGGIDTCVQQKEEAEEEEVVYEVVGRQEDRVGGTEDFKNDDADDATEEEEQQQQTKETCMTPEAPFSRELLNAALMTHQAIHTRSHARSHLHHRQPQQQQEQEEDLYSYRSDAETPLQTPIMGEGMHNEEEDDVELIASLQAQVQNLIKELQAAEERAVLLEGEVREEVAAEMSGLLRDMEESYRERLAVEVEAAENRVKERMLADGDADGCGGGGDGKKKKGGPRRQARKNAKEKRGEEEEVDGDKVAILERENRELSCALEKLQGELQKKEVEALVQVDRLANVLLELEAAKKEAADAKAGMTELRRKSEQTDDRVREEVTQVEANAAMELEMAECQSDRLRKENASLRAQVVAMMATLETATSPSVPLVQRMVGAYQPSEGCGAGGTPHDVALMRARQAVAAAEAEEQQQEERRLQREAMQEEAKEMEKEKDEEQQQQQQQLCNVLSGGCTVAKIKKKSRFGEEYDASQQREQRDCTSVEKKVGEEEENKGEEEEEQGIDVADMDAITPGVVGVVIAREQEAKEEEEEDEVEIVEEESDNDGGVVVVVDEEVNVVPTSILPCDIDTTTGGGGCRGGGGEVLEEEQNEKEEGEEEEKNQVPMSPTPSPTGGGRSRGRSTVGTTKNNVGKTQVECYLDDDDSSSVYSSSSSSSSSEDEVDLYEPTPLPPPRPPPRRGAGRKATNKKQVTQKKTNKGKTMNVTVKNKGEGKEAGKKSSSFCVVLDDDDDKDDGCLGENKVSEQQMDCPSDQPAPSPQQQQEEEEEAHKQKPVAATLHPPPPLQRKRRLLLQVSKKPLGESHSNRHQQPPNMATALGLSPAPTSDHPRFNSPKRSRMLY